MASLRQWVLPGSVRFWCCVISLCLHAFLPVISATEVIRFDQGSNNKQNADSDNIYDILEDEQFVIVDTKLARNHHKTHVTTRTGARGGGNTSLSLPKSPPPPSYLHPRVVNPENSAGTGVAAAGTTSTAPNPKVRTSTTPTMHQSAGLTTTHAGAVRLSNSAEGGLDPEDLEDDFLFFAEERELMERAEEERRHQEHKLALRVKRQTESSGEMPVEVQITTSITWNPNYLNSASQDYIDLVNDVLPKIEAALVNLPTPVTVTITGFQQGSTVILFSVDYGGSATPAELQALARALLDFKRTGVLYKGTNYDILVEPVIEETGIFKAATCFLCASYQTCTEGDSPGTYICKLSSTTIFDYGQSQGDGTMTKDKKRQSEVFKVEGGMPIDGIIIKKVAVSMNGLISFGGKYNSFSPRDLPRGRNQLLCGYWADFQLSSLDSWSNVWYHAYQKTDSTSTADAAMLLRGKTEVEAYSSQENYDPTFMLVATYEMIPPDPSDPTTQERVSFQMMVITDGYSTYAMVIYASGAMQWDASIDRRVTIGYLDVNLNIDVTMPDLVIGNTNLPGVWFFQLGTVSLNPKQACLNWYYDQLPSVADYENAAKSMPACPCSYLAILFSFNYSPYSLQDGVICFLLNTPVQGHGKTCCYKAPWVLERSRPYAGTFLQHHPRADPAGYYMKDEEPKDLCCFQSKSCNKYYKVRPTGRCGRVIIIIIALGRGDPHITTLDGKTFPFNAIGEFTLFKVSRSDLTFEFQGRTCQATNKDGDPIAASVFCALVARNNNSTLQVELSRDGESLTVYINKRDVTLDYKQDGNSFQSTEGGLTVRRSNDTLRANFDSGISLNVTVAFRLLTYELSIEADSGISAPTGLMGNMNGNPDDDFIFPNGTTLPNNTSEKDLLAYGKTWALTTETTHFQYDGGFNTPDYTNDTFVPIFLEDVNQTVRAEAESKCGGADDIGCVFDYIATQDEALALRTKTAKDVAETNKDSAANSIPEVTGPQRIMVKLNEPYVLALNASDAEDPETPSYSFSKPPSNLTFDNATQKAVFTPIVNEIPNIEVAVQDNNGATSAPLRIEIVQCSGCNNDRGLCNYDELRDEGSEYFKIATCDCLPYYSGDDCEDDFDACADEPCPLLTLCTDLSIAEHMAAGENSTGYNCTDCPQGYTLNTTNGDPTCYDVDECLGSPAPCDSIADCTNTQGSYGCTCPSGYRLNTRDSSVCNDINECTDNTDDCEQVCENTDGSFSCSCLEGFTLNATTANTCDKDAAKDPCITLNASCAYGCQNVSGEAQCICPSGYALSNQTHCADVNECDVNICSQKCENFVGGYTCSCFPGYQLDDDKITCNACPANHYGESCNQTCECRGRGSCDSVRGCQCDSGWTGETCNQDVNECETLAKPCEDTHTCVNTNGSYVCNCPTGYTKNDTLCQDTDECLAKPCEQVCTNTVGSFVCSCTSGYNYDAANNTCVVINECALGISECEQRCEDVPGSVNCFCEQGFLLNDDRKTCTIELDPCEALTQTKNCTYRCEVTNGTAECRCRTGYQLAVDGVSCIDIKECDSNSTNDCSRVAGQCVEKLGSYECTCQSGYKLENDQRTCTVCDDYHWGPDCANDCDCHPLNTERCNPKVGCECKDGWLGTYCDQDRDDCQSYPCQQNTQCTDVAGSYRCDCLSGYSQENETAPCEDVDECDGISPCDQSCNNTVGSYICSCNSGFLSEGDKCTDIDECLNNPCDQHCRNTLGGFFCECYSGYLLNTTTRTTCYAKTPCAAGNPCAQGCVMDSNGNETCTCSSGYTKNSSNPYACDDIIECDSSPCVNGSCNNFEGGFNCNCSDGTYLLGDGVTCRVCPENKYGKDCASDCACDPANTASCDSTNGTCTCNEGWTGTDCSEDIDECTATPTICDSVSNSTCVNTTGSHVCQCDVGFSASGGQCLPCDDLHYGTECRSLCPCERANTLKCDDLIGTCTCNAFWKGDNCTEDVDECAADPDLCLTSVHETCRNYDGGHACNCVTGYERASPGLNCTDIKECLDPVLNTCDETKESCVEEEGSFSCICAPGYNGTAGACAATYGNFTVTVTLAWDPPPTLPDPVLQNSIETALTLSFSNSIGPPFHAAVVIELRTGSVLAPTLLQIDGSQTDNAEGLAAKAVDDLLNAGQLEVAGVQRALSSILIDSVTLRETHSVCDAFLALTSCAADQECKVDNQGVPSCSSKDEDDDNADLIIGLAVGIPLFFIAAIVIGAIIYMCVKRRKSSDSVDEQRADNSEHRFPSIFAGQLATKGSWGPAQRYHMYSPDNMSVSHGSDSSGEGQLLKGRRQGRSDFQDSAWYDGRGGASASAISSPRRGDDGPGTEAATSNFSWEYMFRLLQPYRGGLEIQRPNVDPVPNPAYTPRSRGPRPDSMA